MENSNPPPLEGNSNKPSEQVPNAPKKKSKKTLIIVLIALVVLAIPTCGVVGILAAVAIPALAAGKEAAQDHIAQEIFNTINYAKSSYFEKYGATPKTWQDIAPWILIRGEQPSSLKDLMKKALRGGSIEIKDIDGGGQDTITLPNGRVITPSNSVEKSPNKPDQSSQVAPQPDREKAPTTNAPQYKEFETLNVILQVTNSISKMIDWSALKNLGKQNPNKTAELYTAFSQMKENTERAAPILENIKEKLGDSAPENIQKLLFIYNTAVEENLTMCKTAIEFISKYEATGKVSPEGYELVTFHAKRYANAINALKRDVGTTPNLEETNRANVSGEVDIKKCVQILSKGSLEEQIDLIKKISESPEKYPPLVLYMMSNILFQAGEKEEAMFWFYAAQLRARYDANRHTDPNAAKVATQLTFMYGSDINKYSFKNIDQLKSTIQEVEKWDRTTPNNYNPNYLGKLERVTSIPVKDELIPKSQWESVKDNTIQTYTKDFETVAKEIKEGNFQMPVPTPQMVLSLPINKDPDRNWELVSSQGSPTFIIGELTPNGEDPKKWKELITQTIAFGTDLNAYTKKWIKGIKDSGGSIEEAKKLGDGSIFVVYSSPNENGIWKYLQGPDATYGVAYQSRPGEQPKKRLETWKELIKQTELIKNPLDNN
jgi:hypothetical protein